METAPDEMLLRPISCWRLVCLAITVLAVVALTFCLSTASRWREDLKKQNDWVLGSTRVDLAKPGRHETAFDHRFPMGIFAVLVVESDAGEAITPDRLKGLEGEVELLDAAGSSASPASSLTTENAPEMVKGSPMPIAMLRLYDEHPPGVYRAALTITQPATGAGPGPLKLSWRYDDAGDNNVPIALILMAAALSGFFAFSFGVPTLLMFYWYGLRQAPPSPKPTVPVRPWTKPPANPQ
jgi:hypothetical protein